MPTDAYGACARCNRPWPETEIKVTQYTAEDGCFVLCVDCWVELGDAQSRQPYYDALMDTWDADAELRELVRAAVARESEPEPG